MSDTEYPSRPGDYRSGWFGLNFMGDPAGAYANWISPGDRFFRVWSGVNADGSAATPQEIQDATNQWESFTRCQRWRARLFHVAELRWGHDTNDKLWVVYTSSIPANKVDALKTCLDENVFEYLGGTFAQVLAKLDDRNPSLAAHFWPGDSVFAPRQINRVVAGWESDFGL